jgi:hypothetical protein
MPRSSWILGSVLILGGFVLVSEGAVAGGPCISARVEETILLPGGGEHPPGILTICDSHRYSPVASLHRIRVDGRHVAMTVSQRGRSEGSASSDERPFVMFVRDSRGRLELFGYAIPAGKELVTYRIAGANTAVNIAGRDTAPSSSDEASTELLLASVRGH